MKDIGLSSHHICRACLSEHRSTFQVKRRIETKREKSKREKRMAAYVAIALDPAAEVRCPKCHAGTLFVLADVSAGEDQIEKWIQCNHCLITEAMLINTKLRS